MCSDAVDLQEHPVEEQSSRPHPVEAEAVLGTSHTEDQCQGEAGNSCFRHKDCECT